MDIKFFQWQPLRNSVRMFTFFRYIGRLPLAADCLILRYPVGAHLAAHRDPVPGFNTIRCNFVLHRGTGGELVCEQTVFRSRFLTVFRPDKYLHSVTPVTSGTRWMFSIGLGWRAKKKICR